MHKQTDDVSELWDKSATLSKFDNIDIDGDWKKVSKRMNFAPKSKKIPISKYLLRISAIIILAFGLVYLYNMVLKQANTTTQTDYYQITSQSEVKTINLPDGTIATLNKNSNLIYNNNFGNKNRDIILEGEVFFDVSRNESIPFKIFASNSTIEVLGTSLSINTNNEQIQVNVISGHVAFFETKDKENRIELNKNEAIKYNTHNKTFSQKTKLNPNIISWKTKKLEFRDTPLNEVFAAIGIYYELELISDSSNEFSESLTASFENQSIQEVLDIITISTEQKFNVSISKNKLKISNK